jgi:hypothetical protein
MPARLGPPGHMAPLSQADLDHRSLTYSFASNQRASTKQGPFVSGGAVPSPTVNCYLWPLRLPLDHLTIPEPGHSQASFPVTHREGAEEDLPIPRKTISPFHADYAGGSLSARFPVTPRRSPCLLTVLAQWTWAVAVQLALARSVIWVCCNPNLQTRRSSPAGRSGATTILGFAHICRGAAASIRDQLNQTCAAVSECVSRGSPTGLNLPAGSIRQWAAHPQALFAAASTAKHQPTLPRRIWIRQTQTRAFPIPGRS